MSYSATKPRLSRREFAQLQDTLDFQRARYQRSADFHAVMVRQHMLSRGGTSGRSRAHALKLTVDTKRAAALAQKHVSVVPLPLISASYHPFSPPVHAASEELYSDSFYCDPRPAPIPEHMMHTWAVPSHTTDVPADWNAKYYAGMELDDDDDMGLYSDEWDSDEFECSSGYSESSEGEYMDGVPFYASSSESSYGTLLSPYQSGFSVKRKSPDMDTSMHEKYQRGQCHVSVKQPKLLRKSWAQPVRDGAAF